MLFRFFIYTLIRNFLSIQDGVKAEDTQGSAKCVAVFRDDPRLNDMMSKADYVVIGRDTCPWTVRAVSELAAYGRSVQYMDYTKVNGDLQKRLASYLKYKYVPIIIKNGYFLGGYSELNSCMDKSINLNDQPQNQNEAACSVNPLKSMNLNDQVQGQNLSACSINAMNQPQQAPLANACEAPSGKNVLQNIGGSGCAAAPACSI